LKDKNQHINIIISGGGTGGHIFPAVAIAHALRRIHPDSNILFVGANGKMEMEKVPKEGFEIVGLDIAGFDRGNMLKNISLPFKILKSFLQARRIIQYFKPSVVVGVGGFASFPLLYMAQQAGIPTVIQEQNSFAGKSNRILGKKASLICVAYDNMQRFFPKEKIVITGNPIRKEITTAHLIHRKDALDFFVLDNSKKTVFAFGGSLGAKSINETLSEQLHQFKEKNIQLIWQTGANYYQKALEVVKGYESIVKVLPFIKEMNRAYAAADVIIARAGASSIAELCVIAKPVVFVPFPYASEDHQTHNAMALVNNNAAYMVADHQVKNELLTKTFSLLEDTTMSELMKKNLADRAIDNADETIASHILNMIKHA
jgi:UDP-N-acetylglucosamine--N-acetylmuramyl-(pentapeptide) pyrophosphoryl-undecaprenol N-acetylglucosamine transferase (EC 2.4.1.227)